VTLPDARVPELSYVLHQLPPGRFPFRRWRWELWHGPSLLATGWRTSERQAERALRTAASRFTHRLVGLHPLRPDQTAVRRGTFPGGTAHVDCGAVSCLLVPRALGAQRA
jgi:hypothetical protein